MKPAKPTTIAIMALGGQGGGVLADWLIEVAEHSGYIAQGTSVPGVAQRTGATIYYIELFPESAVEAGKQDPVLALMPVPGNLDIVVAAELMEAGRAMMRGFVTLDRTLLIGSSHRVYAISEKSAMGDGRADSAEIFQAAAARAQSAILFDMEELARQKGSVISAVLFGAIAGSGGLPFLREAYEEVIKADSRGKDANLAAFDAGFEGARKYAAQSGVAVSKTVENTPKENSKPPASAEGQRLLSQMAQLCPPEVHDIVRAGLEKTVDYQDLDYGSLFLRRLEPVIAADRTNGGAARGWKLTKETARYLALGMTFDDVFKVADLKTRAARFDRVRQEAGAAGNQIVNVSEFMHPRVEEICDALPRRLGAFVLESPKLRRGLGGLFAKGRRVSTTSLGGFLLLFGLARLRRFRRASLRFSRESALLERWLETVLAAAGKNYALAVEVACCQRLVKGYGDTHARGVANFTKVMSAYEKLPANDDGAQRLRKLREAALSDEEGAALDRELVTIG